MSTLGIFLHALGRRLLTDLRLSSPSLRTYALDLELEHALELLSERERRPKEDIAADLISIGLAHRQVTDAYMQCWQSLTPREQQVAALVCLDYTNPRIAAVLVISPETVKSHVHHILAKFGLRSKAELRQALEEWDFSDWERR